MKKNISILLVLSFVLVVGCKKTSEKTDKMTSSLNTELLEVEQYRPLFHFTPKANWMSSKHRLIWLRRSTTLLSLK